MRFRLPKIKMNNETEDVQNRNSQKIKCNNY